MGAACAPEKETPDCCNPRRQGGEISAHIAAGAVGSASTGEAGNEGGLNLVR